MKIDKPTITAFNNMNHTHISAAQGGKIPVAGIDATGTPDATTYLKGDGTWAAVTATISSDVYAFAAAQG